MSRFLVCIMSFIIDPNRLYVCSSMLSIFIILMQFTRIFIASNQQRGEWDLLPLFMEWIPTRSLSVARIVGPGIVQLKAHTLWYKPGIFHHLSVVCDYSNSSNTVPSSSIDIWP